MKFPVFFFFLLLFSITVFANQSKEQEIRTILENRDNQIKELLGPEGADYTDEQREQLRDIINEMMDYRKMAQYALGDKFDELSVEEREEFVDLFTRIIRDQSLQQMDIYRADVVYEEINVEGSEAKVTTTAIFGEKRIPILYRLAQHDGEWVITDLSIDEAWTAESYRRSFQNIIRRRGYDALIDNLRKRAEQA